MTCLPMLPSLLRLQLDRNPHFHWEPAGLLFAWPAPPAASLPAKHSMSQAAPQELAPLLQAAALLLVPKRHPCLSHVEAQSNEQKWMTPAEGRSGRKSEAAELLPHQQPRLPTTQVMKLRPLPAIRLTL